MTDREATDGSAPGLESTDLPTILDAVPEVFYVFTASGEFRYWNDALASVTGYADEEIAAMSPPELVAEADRDRIADAIGRVAEGGEHEAVTADLVTKDGEEVPYEFSGCRVAGGANDETLIAGVGREFTEHAERERELRLENERLEEFTAVVSHDLRNPLDVANARLELAEAECDSDHIGVARESLRRMAAIVDRSLTLAKQGRYVTDADWLSLETAARASWRVVETGTATLEVAEDSRIRADADRIQHVFENLFRNAIEHGGEDVAVRVGPTDEGFFVADDGPGIDPADRETVFEPGVTDAADGTGFGLSIVRRVAEAHGWEVAVTESADGGARFEFTGVETAD